MSGADARRTFELLTALYKSAFTGQPVTRGSIKPNDPFYAELHGGSSPWRASNGNGQPHVNGNGNGTHA